MMDDSAIFHIDTLDEEHRKDFDAREPWIFEFPESRGSLFWETQTFRTEDEACAAQRSYRKQHGFDEITGKKAA